MHPWVPTSISAPRKLLGFPSENSIFQTQSVNHFLWFICPLLPDSLTPCHSVLNFSPSTSSIITKQSGLNFAYLNHISLFYFQSCKMAYFSFFKFPLNCTVRLFTQMLGYTEAYFPPVVVPALYFGLLCFPFCLPSLCWIFLQSSQKHSPCSTILKLRSSIDRTLLSIPLIGSKFLHNL